MLDINLKNNYFWIFIIILLSAIVDGKLIFSINNPPAWDQGYHLSNVFKMYNILDYGNLNILDKTNEILNITNTYRGPLTYFLSALFLKIFGNTYYFAYFSNQIFNLICILSLFYLGKLFRNESTGIWASVIFTFSSFIIIQRTDYLIDLSLTAFSTCNFLFLTYWYLDKKKNSKFSILSGISLGLIFLIKPTGIILFILSLLTIFIKILKNKNGLISNLNEVFLFFISFTLISYPWFSRHWITIISSVINAWNWGVNYQDGYGKSSIANWLFYFKEIPTIFGLLNSIIFSTLFLFEKIFQNNILKVKINNFRKINLWFLIYLFNSYLIISLMSTKDIRFLLPSYPILCIYLSTFITSKNSNIFSIRNKKIILASSICFTLFLNNEFSFNILKNESPFNFPHSDIVNEIKNNNKNLTSTLAVLPDTKEINTFNLEAEAARKGEYIFVRQVISNKNTFKEDLKYFDWFLVKTGSQGIMSSEAKNLLTEYLINNESFVEQKKWILNDKSELILLRRKFLNSYLEKIKCIEKNPTLEIKKINRGININIIGSGEKIKSSSLLIDFLGKDFKKTTNVSLANGFFHNNFNEESCYYLSQNVPITFPENSPSELNLIARLINKDGDIDYLKSKSKNLIINQNTYEDKHILMANRIEKVELLGNYLKNGEFQKLFDLVGIINQSDPKQIYLTDAEKIYMKRYQENNYLKDLYSILISQILQRKISDAEETINLIIEKDNKNGNAFLTKSIIDIYLLDGKDSRFFINKAKLLDKSEESSDILKTLDGITYLLEMKFINAYKTLI